ncbi:ABC transporter substrate-binding protein [Aureitalea sp. L0-47]|uniref:ABC transporter substrate-binding protein n=1 Tax=Aureitalea sp. L0-47 TaxID=2816962 RepID=UPI0022385B80|nr:ABC transporter substrate-binding protein [Aureitalea sp. L0-47]MCW5519696.1 ABC transporter substrate-binding protein [Aureitalea sp. L0-47]
MRIFTVVVFCLSLLSCKDIQKSPSLVDEVAKKDPIEIQYAEGFSIHEADNYITLTVKNPWPSSDESFTYELKKKGLTPEEDSITGRPWHDPGFHKILKYPVESIVVTSTTHIPSLDMLDVTDKLVGFPNLNYISSEKARTLISEGKIKELGQNEAINTEVLIDLEPDAVITFAVDGTNKTVENIKQAGIPVLYNADWTEKHPLGKAEWIKFFGALFDKQKEADSIFREIETEYFRVLEIAKNAKIKPTVLSGAMYKDIWYMPQGDSWAAKFIEDANGDYLWKETEGTGSLSMSLESVLEKGQNAEFWIGPGQFTSVEQFEEAHSVYSEFLALQNGNVYTFTSKKGETGGILYYELAPNRPDLVLKDIVKILHPELLPDHELFFFSKVE